MPSLALRHRRDPRWQEDGPAARDERRRRRIREFTALACAMVAAAAAAALWCLQLGLIGGGGFRLGLPTG
jgi:hypothetical protein